jgi:hypothetical protein
MLTRRDLVHGAAAAAASFGMLRTGDAGAGAAGTVKTPVDFDVPRGACDCHVHVFDPARFQYAGGRVYTPPEATAGDLMNLQNALHFDRVVIVTPSVYGVDNACTINAMKTLGPGRGGGGGGDVN